jgi:hypothetical protein
MDRTDQITQLKQYLRYGAHSFRAIRNHTTLKLSDDQFHKFIKENSHIFRQAITIKKQHDKDIYYSRTFGMSLHR